MKIKLAKLNGETKIVVKISPHRTIVINPELLGLNPDEMVVLEELEDIVKEYLKEKEIIK